MVLIVGHNCEKLKGLFKCRKKVFSTISGTISLTQAPSSKLTAFVKLIWGNSMCTGVKQ